TGSLIYNILFKGQNPGLAYVVAIAAQTFILLVFGEITPKTYAIKHSEKFSKSAAGPLWVFSQVIYPFRKALRFITDIFLPLLGVRPEHEKLSLTSDEIRAIIKATEAEGALEAEEGEILHNIFDLPDIEAREAMIPRIKMVSVEISTSIQEAFNMTQKSGFSRLPVYRKSIDNICGIFYVKDLPRWKGLRIEGLGGRTIEQLTIEEFLANSEILNELNPGNEKTLVRPPFFAFVAKKIGALMREMTREKKQMAILLDEFGGVSGMITTEDIVEEVLGEIFDEYDTVSELTITRDSADPSSILIPGFASVRSVNKRLKLRIDVPGIDTIGGYVVRLFGSIPLQGDVVTDRAHGLEFEILQMEGKRIGLLKLRFMKTKPEKKAKPFHLSLLLFPLFGLALAGAPAENTAQGGGIFLLIYAFILVFSLLLIGFYAGAETAVVSASKAKIDILADQRNTRAAIIKKLWLEPDKMLGTVLVGTNLMSTAAGVAGLRLTNTFLSGREGIQELVNTVVMTLIILVFCEIIPKTTFRAKADTLALRSAPGLWISSILYYPIVSLVTKITNFAVKIAGEEESKEKIRIMREELRLLAKMGAKEGILKREQLRMISSVLDLETLTLEKVMTPLVDITALPKETHIEKFYKNVSKTGFSRIPVYEGRIDNLIGRVNVLDVLYSEKPASTIAPFVKRDVPHEPESKHVYSLLQELRRSRNQMVFVVDEYGGVVGLVTIEDLIEEILGEIRDEKDREEEDDIHKISDDLIECDGKTEIQTINNLSGMSIPSGEYNTIAGYIIFLTERIPKRGEFVETESLKITVIDADSKSIRRVQIQRK
ncbi:MAG: hemolysin family protein, partial [Candidatus Aminicenantes bacterium]|nr:hemolysin family protein [Candidatus Aminicenantes bacterium]